MSRFRFTVEYEGTRYSGWQVQKNARTVQGEIIGALRQVLGSDDFEFMGSGRTDAGVHALGQIAHLEARTMLSPHVLRMKINDLLPSDVNVIEITKAQPKFHARHHAISRSYVYQISQRRTAFGKRYVWWIKDELNIEAMKGACSIFEGFHDFRSFTQDDPEAKSTTVDLEVCQLFVSGPLILINIRGSHFLWRMVRQMIGMIVECGRGAMTPEHLSELLRTESSFPATKTAPPSGLYLHHVQYDKHEERPSVQPMIHIR
ncbi:MAG: tRNA pseudouridine(38-40) synthase TruA [Candidatus Kapabacteria bacterium]|nr:tRNA pseudouridine(38-40) synthase TruA [Candidatus Kapabacteria bacterium]